MTHAPQSLRIGVAYNKNKFFKQPITAAETGIVAERCPCCGGNLEPFLAVRDRADSAVLERGACAGCGFVSFTRMPHGDWFETFYRSDWDLNRGEESIQGKIEAPYEPLFDLLDRHIAPEAHVLEIGAGYGGALNRLREKGVRTLRGIEASAKRQTVCRDQLGLDVSLVTSEKMETAPEIVGCAPYDLVFSWHVIEHVVDLDRTFAAVARMLRPGGRFVIGVPNIEHEHLVYLAHFLPHIHAFTPYGLTLLLARHGLEVEHIDDKIRAVARRVEGEAVVNLSVGARDVPAAYAEKVARDLDLDGLLPGRPFFLDYCVKMFRESAGEAQTAGAMSVGERMSFAMKRMAIGCGHNLRPVLNPRFQPLNAVDPANAAHWLVARAASFGDMEFGGILESVRPAEGPSGMPAVEFVYPGRHGYAWIK